MPRSGPTSPALTGRRFPMLDGLRGLAALCVMVLHRGSWFHLHGWLGHGYLAVDFFFMLSGFVIAAAYDERLARGLGLREFARIRLIRLWPLIALGMALGAGWQVVAGLAGHGDTGPGEALVLLLRGLALVPTFARNSVGVGVFPLDAPTWSLFFEIVANLAYALAFRWLGFKRLAAVTVVAGIGLAVTAAIAGNVDAGGTCALFLGGFPRVGFAFFAGLLLHRAALRFPVLAKVQAPLWLSSLVLLAVLALKTRWTPDPAYDLVAVMVVFPALILGGLGEARGLMARVCDEGGRLSYPVYILHYPIYIVVGGLAAMTGGFAPYTDWRLAAIAAPLILVASWLAARFFDEPARRALARWRPSLPGLRPRLPAAAPTD